MPVKGKISSLLSPVFSGQLHPLVSANTEALSGKDSLQEETIWMLSEPHRAEHERESKNQEIARSFGCNTEVENEELRQEP